MVNVPRQGLLGLSGYHWLVLAAAWLGWGFDVFDALLFNFVAPNCVPALLHLPLGSPEARHATVFWTGILTSILLVGWAAGGLLFGWFADRYGRKRALFVTIALYACGTALCSIATDLWQLVLFRTLASLGIGGEWSIGATLVAETVPEDRRVTAATLVYTSSPIGIMLASAVNYQIAGVWLVGSPETSWRYVFLCGLAPVVVAFLARIFVRESEVWERQVRNAKPVKLSELFAPSMRAYTLSGLVAAVTALVTWWACNAFVPLLGATLAHEFAAQTGLTGEAARTLSEAWKSQASNGFNLGGLLGALAAIPLARVMGRRTMFITYFLYSAVLLFITFGLDFTPAARLHMLFAVGIGVYGVFSTFVFYLPELFPARLRATGSGLCYNIGRVVAALGPTVVGLISAASGGTSGIIVRTLFWLGVIPLITALAARFIIVETRGRALPD
ncbi:MAG TPA: MFS transporter [Steroidobacteraceae bacterium]|jgi:MFS family permease|nr:MFS transporter [Steroidobacteraceae bacterium]